MKLKRAAAHNCDSRVFIKNYWSVLMADGGGKNSCEGEERENVFLLIKINDDSGIKKRVV
jgi:hypothetical protein